MGKRLIGRRDFMKSTLAGFGGLFFLPPVDMKQEVKIVEAKGKEKKLVYRTLGKTGLKLPPSPAKGGGELFCEFQIGLISFLEVSKICLHQFLPDEAFHRIAILECFDDACG